VTDIDTQALRSLLDELTKEVASMKDAIAALQFEMRVKEDQVNEVMAQLFGQAPLPGFEATWPS
jgi:hypothetical protein